MQDNTLLKQINVLAGIKHKGIVIVNHDNEEELLNTLKPPINITVACIDATTIAQKYLGRPVVNTAMVGSIIKLAKLVDVENAMKAVKKLFPGSLGEKNAQAILDAYMNTKILQEASDELPPTIEEKVTSHQQEIELNVNDPIAMVKKWTTEKWGYEKLPVGTVVPIAGSSLAFKTGDWAAVQPELVKEKCLSCLTCFFVCPDSAIKMDYSENPKGYPIILKDYCKGCGICAYECDERALLFPGIAEKPLGVTDVKDETHCDDEGGS